MAEKSFEFTASLPTGGSEWEHIRGSIQEVLNTLSNKNIKASQLVYWYDDGYNAVATICKRK